VIRSGYSDPSHCRILTRPAFGLNNEVWWRCSVTGLDGIFTFPHWQAMLYAPNGFSPVLSLLRQRMVKCFLVYDSDGRLSYLHIALALYCKVDSKNWMLDEYCWLHIHVKASFSCLLPMYYMMQGISLSCILYENIIYTIYICNPQSQLFLFVCYLTTCFGLYGPSSGEKMY
jgi:hypothetical protein